MWVRVCHLIQKETDLTPREKFVLIAIMARFSKHKDGVKSFPSWDRLAADCGMSKRTIQTTVNSVVRKDWLLRWNGVRGYGEENKRPKHFYRPGYKLKAIKVAAFPTNDRYSDDIETGTLTT